MARIKMQEDKEETTTPRAVPAGARPTRTQAAARMWATSAASKASVVSVVRSVDNPVWSAAPTAVQSVAAAKDAHLVPLIPASYPQE